MWIAMVDALSLTQTWVRSEVWHIIFVILTCFHLTIFLRRKIQRAAFYKQSGFKICHLGPAFIIHFVFRRQRAEMKWKQDKIPNRILQRLQILPRFGLTCTFAWRPHLLFHLQTSEQSPRPVLIFPPQLLLEQPQWVNVSKSCWNLLI